MKRLLTGILLTLILALPTDGLAAYLILSAHPTQLECDVADPGPGGEVIIYVIYGSQLFGSALGVAFAAPVPPECGLVHLYDSVPSPFIALGNSQSGVEVAFTDCEFDATVIAMHFARVSAGKACCPYYLTPHPDFEEVIYFDCSLHVKPLHNEIVMLNSDGTCVHTLPPSNPSPPDGASEVPSLTQLGWNEAQWLCEMPNGVEGPVLYFGTSPDPPKFGFIYINPYPVGPLQQLTTYYWRIASFGHLGPVWSFTTTGPSPVATSTWGRIKALYR